MTQTPVDSPSGSDSIDERAALNRFLRLTAIPGRSGQEFSVADAIREMLSQGGVEPSQMTTDGAAGRTRLAGNCDNLIVTLPGDPSQPRTLLSAHMDTVPICVGCQPEVIDDPPLGRIVVAGGETGLGADDRAGCAVLVTAVLERLRRLRAEPDRATRVPPAVIAFLVQEEIGLEGARNLDVSKIGAVDRGFNFDGGTMDGIRHGAIGGERMKVTVRGHASHAGVAPEKGVSAITIAGLAVAELHQQGWLGKVSQDGREGTANIGVFQGGEATNVVTPEVTLRAEARSHDAAFRGEIVGQIRAAFRSAADQVRDDQGRGGTIEFESQVDYEAFALPIDHPSVAAATERLRRLGYEPTCKLANGGLDANWLFRHGIEAVTLGCGQAAIHTVDEHLLVPHFLDACRLATDLVLN